MKINFDGTEKSDSGWVSRRALVTTASASACLALVPRSVAAQPVEDGLCRGPNVLRNIEASPWLVTFNPQLHPLNASERPTMRPGQPIKGSWRLFTWSCPNTGATTERFTGTPDNSHPLWTLEMTFEDDVVIAQTEAGTFSGVPDAATQSDFYSLSLPQTRTLQLVVRDESGSVIGPPGILSRIPAQPLGPRPRPTSSGTIQLDLLPDSANSIVFDSPTPADGTVFMWKTDTFTLAIAGNSSPTIPGSPFSAMTATGDIIMTDETATSPLPSQTTAYSISFPVGAMGAGGTAATGPQNFQWPWFDHVPLGGISGPTSRNIRYDLSGTIADTFGNKYPVLAASRKYRIDVAQTKQVFVAASIDSYMSATMFAAAAVIAGFAAAAAAASGVGWIAAAVAAAIAAGFLAASAYQTTLGQGQQSNAADPPSADPEYAQLYPFTNQAGEKLPETEGLGNLRQFIIACGTVTQIFPAISKTEGRILGARRANDTAGVGRQKEYLTRLLQVMSAAAARMASSANAAIQDIASQPITTGQLTEELATWPARGIPGNIQEKWSAAGLSPHEIGIIRNRLADPALRGRVVDYRNHIKSLSDHLTSAAVGVQDEAQKFLAI